VQAGDPVGEEFGHSFPNLSAWSGEFLAAENIRRGYQKVESGYDYGRSCKNTEKLRNELLSRIGPEKIAGLEVSQKVGG